MSSEPEHNVTRLSSLAALDLAGTGRRPCARSLPSGISLLESLRYKFSTGGFTDEESTRRLPALEPEEAEVSQLFLNNICGETYSPLHDDRKGTARYEVLGVLMYDATERISVPVLIVGGTGYSGFPPCIRLVVYDAPLGLMEDEVSTQPPCLSGQCTCFRHMLHRGESVKLYETARNLATLEAMNAYASGASSVGRPTHFELDNFLPWKTKREGLQLERWGIIPFLRIRPCETEDEVQACACVFFDAVSSKTYNTDHMQALRAPGTGVQPEELNMMQRFGCTLASSSVRYNVHLVSEFMESCPHTPRKPQESELGSWVWKISEAHASRRTGIQTLLNLAMCIVEYGSSEVCEPNPDIRPGTIGGGDEDDDAELGFGRHASVVSYPTDHIDNCVKGALIQHGDRVPSAPTTTLPPSSGKDAEIEQVESVADENTLFEMLNEHGTSPPFVDVLGTIGTPFSVLETSSMGQQIVQAFGKSVNTVPFQVLASSEYIRAGPVAREVMEAVEAVYRAVPSELCRPGSLEIFAPQIHSHLDLDVRTYTECSPSALHADTLVGKVLVNSNVPIGHVANSMAALSAHENWRGGLLLVTVCFKDASLHTARIASCVFASAAGDMNVCDIPEQDTVRLYRRRDVLTFVRFLDCETLSGRWAYLPLKWREVLFMADPASYLTKKCEEGRDRSEQPSNCGSSSSLGLVGHSGPSASSIRIITSSPKGTQRSAPVHASRSIHKTRRAGPTNSTKSLHWGIPSQVP